MSQLLAALLLLNLPSEHEVFLVLSNLLNRPLPLAFLTGDPAATNKAYELTLSLLATKFPRLHSHLFGPAPTPPSSPSAMAHTANCNASNLASPESATCLFLDPASVLEPFYRTLFLTPHGGLGVDIAARVWDMILLDGDAAVIRTAVALLGSLEGKLYGDRASVMSVIGWNGKPWADSLDGEDAFMARVRDVGKR